MKIKFKLFMNINLIKINLDRSNKNDILLLTKI